MSNNVKTNNKTAPEQFTLLKPEMFNDIWCAMTTNPNEFIKSIRDYEKNDKYITVRVSDIVISPLVDFEDEIDAEFPSELADAVSDTQNHLQLYVTFKDEEENEYKLPLRETAHKSLLDRAKINGHSLTVFKKTQLSRVLNMCYELYPNTYALCYINNNKVNAVLSGDENDYAILPLIDLVEILHKRFTALKFTFKFIEGYIDHSYCFSKYEITDGNLLDAYKKALDDNKIPYNPSKLSAAVQFASSNVGLSTAKVSSFIKNDDRYIPLGTACQVQHRGKKTVEDFDNCLNGMFGSYQEAIVGLTKLMGIKLNHPVDTMVTVCRKLKLPSEQCRGAIALFESYANSNMTAYDVYCALGEVIFNCTVSGVPETKTLIVTEDITKALGFSERDWHKMDAPIKYRLW